jgi:hypothetical protein
MPAAAVLVVFAEFPVSGALIPTLRGGGLKTGEARRIGLAMLRDTVEKAYHCAGLDPLVAYYPPNRRGEVEDAIGDLPVWAEPMLGPSPGGRIADILRHMLEERAYGSAAALFPLVPTVPRQRIFDAVHKLRKAADFVVGRTADGSLGLLAVREQVPEGLAQALDSEDRVEAIERAVSPKRRAARVDLPTAILTEDDLAHAVFDLRAELATGRKAGHDVPVHTLEIVSALGFETELVKGDRVRLRRVGPPVE